MLDARWDLVREAENDEVRAASDLEKLGKLAALMAAAREVEAASRLHDGREEDERVWAMWQRLRRAAGVAR